MIYLRENSYIFLRKDRKTFEQKDGFNILLYPKVLEILKENFNIEMKKDEYNTTDLKTGIINLEKDNVTYSIDFKLSSANGVEYLDLIVKEKGKRNSINLMEYIHSIISNIEKFQKNFIIIISYDSISEYYCNLIFPKLGKFERKFRKLLFIIYTAQFEKLFFETTIPENVVLNVKENLKLHQYSKSKKKEFLLQNCMYSLTFGTMRSMLFDKQWLPYDEKNEVDVFLKENKDLSKLSDKELREKIKTVRQPINDWERLFQNKGLDDFETVITKIGELRNLVAHNKLFYKEQYEELKKLLDKSIKDVDKAVLITESEDFENINMKILEGTISKIADAVSKYIDSYINSSLKIIEEGNKAFQNVLKTLNQNSITAICNLVSESAFNSKN